MKILYLISCLRGMNSGVGGHNYSLITIATAMARSNTVKVVLNHDMECPAFNTYQGTLLHISHQSLRDDIKSLVAIIREEKPDALHSFDRISHCIAKAASAQTQTPLVITKPGDILPRYTYPHAYDVTVFTQADVDFFKNHPYFRNARISNIPNRTTKPIVNEKRLLALQPYVKEGAFKIMFISTFNNRKFNTHTKCIELIKRLNLEGFKAQGIFIGNINEQSVYDKLLASAGENCTLLTSEEFFDNASEFLAGADAAVTMGRSTQEAAAYGKPILCCAHNLDIPYLLNDSNFEHTASHNFTNRTTVDMSGYDALASISSLITSPQAYTQACEFSKRQFAKYWDVEMAVPKYCNLYASARPACNLPLEKYLQATVKLLYDKGRKLFSKSS